MPSALTCNCASRMYFMMRVVICLLAVPWTPMLQTGRSSNTLCTKAMYMMSAAESQEDVALLSLSLDVSALLPRLQASVQGVQCLEAAAAPAESTNDDTNQGLPGPSQPPPEQSAEARYHLCAYPQVQLACEWEDLLRFSTKVKLLNSTWRYKIVHAQGDNTGFSVQCTALVLM